jgi:hypothetical protein
METDSNTVALDIARFALVSDDDIERIFCQHFARTMCDAPAAFMLDNGQCCKFGEQANHFAPDDPNRPRPITEPHDFLVALEQAAEFFGDSLEYLTHFEKSGREVGRWEVYVTRVKFFEDPKRAPLLEQAYFPGEELPTYKRLRGIARAYLVCLLTIAYAPNTVAVQGKPAPALTLPALEPDADAMPLEGVEL